MEYSTEDLIKYHRLCTSHKTALSQSERAGCFYCLTIFPTSHIKNWCDGKPDYTAFCPVCGHDSVLPDNDDVQISEELLKAMQLHWFHALVIVDATGVLEKK